MVGVQVLDELVGGLPVPCVRQHVVQLLLQHLAEAALADLVLDQAVLGHVFVKVFHQDHYSLLQLCVAVFSHGAGSPPAGPASSVHLLSSRALGPGL